MSKQSRVSNAAEHELPFFPFAYDEALIGYAVRGTENGLYYTSCYGYQALKAVLNRKTNSPEESYKEYSKLIASRKYPECPLIVSRWNHTILWNKILHGNFPRWAHLDKAIIGLGFEQWRESGIVYNAQLCVELLKRDQATLETNPMKVSAELYGRLNTEIIPVCLGEKSPWFITNVK